MLSKEYRLNRREIEELKSKKGSVLQGRFFGLIFQAQKDERRFALIVSNKISKKAVVRNKIKRLFFQILQKGLTDFPQGKFLFLAKKYVAEADADALENELVYFGKQLH